MALRNNDVTVQGSSYYAAHVLCVSSIIISGLVPRLDLESGNEAIGHSDLRVWINMIQTGKGPLYKQTQKKVHMNTGHEGHCATPMPSAHPFVSVVGPNLSWSHHGHEQVG